MNFSIRKKFFVIAIIGLISIFFMIFLATNTSKDSFYKLQNVFIASKEVHKIEEDFIYPLFSLREISLSLVMAPNESFRSDIRRNLMPLTEILDKNFHSLKNEKLELIWKNYKKLVLLTDSYIKQGFEEGAFTNSNTSERKQFYILLGKLTMLQNAKLKKSHDTFEGIKKDFSKNEKFILLSSFFVIIFSFMLFFSIANNVVKSIDILQNGLKRFFDLLGRKIDINENIKISLNNKDEFCQMADMINENVEIARARLQKDLLLIKNATSVVNELKKGHLDRRFSIQSSIGELNELKSVLNEMLDNLEERIKDEIQKRVQKEQLLIQQSKLASMGNMIGNIAHQWRQPLSEIGAILMNLEVKKEHDDLDDETFHKTLDECNVILSHMSNTISDFQNFFKPSKEKSMFSLQEACKNASFIIASSLKHNNIDFRINIKEEAKVYGYPREFSQTILNLLSNAKDVLTQRNIKDPFIELTIKTGKKYAIVTVEDNGGGISPEVADRIYEPYFTTKHAKKGTGIGLYMSKTIIEENMGGFISFSNTKQGALFKVKLAL